MIFQKATAAGIKTPTKQRQTLSLSPPPFLGGIGARPAPRPSAPPRAKPPRPHEVRSTKESLITKREVRKLLFLGTADVHVAGVIHVLVMFLLGFTIHLWCSRM